jgi:hypothetical protein
MLQTYYTVRHTCSLFLQLIRKGFFSCLQVGQSELFSCVDDIDSGSNVITTDGSSALRNFIVFGGTQFLLRGNGVYKMMKCWNCYAKCKLLTFGMQFFCNF